MSFQYIQDYYNVPAEQGRRINHRGRAGTIIEAAGQYIRVVFDDDEDQGMLVCHPTYEMEYAGMARKLPIKQYDVILPWRNDYGEELSERVFAATRSKARYSVFQKMQEYYDLEGKDLPRFEVRRVKEEELM